MTSTQLAYLNIIPAIVGFLAPAWEIIFSKSKHLKLIKRITPVGWVCFVNAVLIVVISYFTISTDATEKSTTQTDQITRDSSNAAKYADSLKAYNDTNSKNLKDYGQNIINLLGQYQLRYDSATNRIVKAIDTTKTHNEPLIGFPINDIPIEFHQSNDTFYINPRLANDGNAAALNVKLKVYFLYEKNSSLYEYYKEIGEMTNLDIKENTPFGFIEGCFVPHYYFDTNNSQQLLLILGTYNDDKNNSKRIALCYMWNPTQNSWNAYGDEKLIESKHFSKDVTLFR